MTELVRAADAQARAAASRLRRRARRLQRRLIDAYETPSVNALDVVLAATSMSAMLNDVEYFAQIGKQDKQHLRPAHDARNAMFAARQRTRMLKRRSPRRRRRSACARDQQHAVTAAADLVAAATRDGARTSKRDTLSSIKVEREASSSPRRSPAGGERRARGEDPGGATCSRAFGGAGLGLERQRPTVRIGVHLARQRPAHEPVRLALPRQRRLLVPSRASTSACPPAPRSMPPRAAPSSTRAGLGGYGNLTVIDHGRGLATAYGHQSSIAVGNGALVSQGQVIGYVGCTGYCFGAHLHFEVRVNGAPRGSARVSLIPLGEVVRPTALRAGRTSARAGRCSAPRSAPRRRPRRRS